MRLFLTITPFEVAHWIDEMVTQSSSALAKAKKSAAGRMSSPAFRRAEEDILILNGLGRYFASLFRAALCYSLFQSTRDKQIATEGLKFYRSALESWRAMSVEAKSRCQLWFYTKSSGPLDGPYSRDRAGCRWLGQYFASANVTNTGVNAIALISVPRSRANYKASYTPALAFHLGDDLTLRLQVAEPIIEAVLWYRHVTHAERWLSKPMGRGGQVFTAAIPGSYTQSPFPLQYYFQLRSQRDATFYPPINATLSNQPYFAVHRRK
jgi:hypothetical protein